MVTTNVSPFSLMRMIRSMDDPGWSDHARQSSGPIIVRISTVSAARRGGPCGERVVGTAWIITPVGQSVAGAQRKSSNGDGKGLDDSDIDHGRAPKA